MELNWKYWIWDVGHLPNQFLGGAIESLVEVSISRSASIAVPENPLQMSRQIVMAITETQGAEGILAF